MLQGVTELNPGITVTSINGVSAYDMISRRAMLDGLRQVGGGPASLPFVRMFYDTPSEYLWEDSGGVVHSIPQGEGGEHGDPMMPLLFSLGHHALEVVNRSLREDEKVMAFLDDIYFCSEPNRVGGSMSQSRMHCRTTLACPSMEARPKGMRLGCARQLATLWRRSRGRFIPQPGCGEDPVCPLSNEE